MKIEVTGDALRLLDHFIHYSTLYPERLADAMWYDPDWFLSCLHLLNKAFREASADPAQRKTEKRKREQPPLPDDFCRRFPDSMGEKIREWLDYKTERKDFYSPTGLRNLLTQIDKQIRNHSVELVIDLISECMANNWAGIIWDKIERRRIRPYGQPDRYSKGRTPSSFDNPWNSFLVDRNDNG